MEWEKKEKAFIQEKNNKRIQARIEGWSDVGTNTALVLISGMGQTLKGLKTEKHLYLMLQKAERSEVLHAGNWCVETNGLTERSVDCVRR